MAPIPAETARVAHAAFPKGTLCLQIRDTLGLLYEDAQFAALFSPTGQPAEAPARLALVLILQCVENLSDRQAAEAVRGRIDWKYALALELTDPGFDASVLSEFRTRLVHGGAATCSSSRCCSSSRPTISCKPAARNAPIPRISWPLSGRSIAWNSSARLCATP